MNHTGRQSDLFGTPETSAGPFKDLPNMRASVAQRKAELVLTLGRLANKTPPPDRIDSVQKTREYLHTRAAAMKVAGSRSSSVPELEGSIERMRKWVGP